MDEDKINVPPNFLFDPTLNINKINIANTIIVLCIFSSIKHMSIVLLSRQLHGM